MDSTVKTTEKQKQTDPPPPQAHINISSATIQNIKQFVEPDIELNVGGEIIKANQFLLMIHSPTFKTLFTGNFNKDGPYTLDHNPTIFTKLVELIHNSELEATHDQLIELINLADFYNMTRIQLKLNGSLNQLLTKDNMYDTYLRVNPEETKHMCIERICSHFAHNRMDVLGDTILKHINDSDHMLAFIQEFKLAHKNKDKQLLLVVICWYIGKNTEQRPLLKHNTQKMLQLADLTGLPAAVLGWLCGAMKTLNLYDSDEHKQVFSLMTTEYLAGGVPERYRGYKN